MSARGEGRTALVTGATGFVGSHLVRRLLADRWDVHVLARPRSVLERLGEAATRVVVHRHDGTTESLCRLVSRTRPDVVFHLASHFLAQHKSADVGPLVDSNVRFGAQLLEAMVVAGVHGLVNAGTSWQHYQSRPYSPVCLYAATKQAFEAILQFYVESSPLRVVTLKLFDTYGPNDPRPKLFTLLRQVAREGAPLPMSPGEQLLDLVYIDDAVEAFVAAGERVATGDVPGHEAYAVSSGERVTLRDVVATYGRVLGIALPIAWGARAYRPREVMVPWSAGESLPGWRPRTSLEDGLRAMEASTVPTADAAR